MRFSYTIIFLLAFWANAFSQTSDGLIAYLSFNECDFTDSAGNSSGLAIGDPECENCGVKERGMRFNGFGDQAIIIGGVSNLFTTKDFSISFYFKPVGTGGTQSLITYRDSCNNEHAFEISYTPSSGIVEAFISENSSKQATVQAEIDFNSCWQHVVFTRGGINTSLYINGEKKSSNSSVSRIDLSSNADIRLAGGACVDITNIMYEGIMDEIRFFNRLLKPNEVEEHYFAPDKISTNRDTLLYLGNSLEVNTNQNCPNYRFEWTPDEDILDPTDKNAVITPSIAGTQVYTISMIDDMDGCIAYDSLKLRVVDPDSLDCTQVYLPKAFTPDGKGPQKNNSFGLSNPFAVTDLISLEIFDRWGNRIFFASDPFETWDGTYKSKDLNPGVFLWRMRFLCRNEELIEVGSLTLLR